MKNIASRMFYYLVPQWIQERLEEHFGNEGLKKYVRNTTWALAAKVISVLVSFVVTIYLVRYLGPENYGKLSYAVSFLSIFAVISNLGIDSVLYRELIVYPEKRNVYLGSAFIIKLCASLLATVLTILGALLFAKDDVSQLIIIILSGTFVFKALYIIVYEFQANVQQKYPAIASLCVVLILNILKIGVITFDKGILYMGVILLIESILFATLLVYIRIKHYGSFHKWSYDKKIILSILKDSWPFIFIALFTSIYSRIDQVALRHMVDASAVGIYDAAVRIVEVWFFIPGLITASLFPAIVNSKIISIAEYKKRLFSLIGFLVGSSIIIAAITSLIAKPLIATLYGPDFIQSASVFSIYIWAGIFISINTVLYYYLLNENKQKLIFFTSLGTMILNIVLNILLIPHLGVIGAAWATLISYTILILPIIKIIKHKEETGIVLPLVK